jgi:hypothetical protein
LMSEILSSIPGGLPRIQGMVRPTIVPFADSRVNGTID